VSAAGGNSAKRRDAAVDALVSAMSRGRGKRLRTRAKAGGSASALSAREKLLRGAWLRGQVNARHGWKRRPPRAWLLGMDSDLERNRFFYAGYDAMSRQRRSGRGVTLMPVPDPQWVEALHLLRPASDRAPAATRPQAVAECTKAVTQ